jgi:hypothetical protein
MCASRRASFVDLTEPVGTISALFVIRIAVSVRAEPG